MNSWLATKQIAHKDEWTRNGVVSDNEQAREKYLLREYLQTFRQV